MKNIIITFIISIVILKIMLLQKLSLAIDLRIFTIFELIVGVSLIGIVINERDSIFKRISSLISKYKLIVKKKYPNITKYLNNKEQWKLETHLPIKLIILFILVFGILSRTNNLGGLSLHQDEAYYTIAAKNYEIFKVSQINWRKNWKQEDSDKTVIKYSRAKPLVIILSFWGKFFGYSEVALRSLFAITGSLSLILIYLISKKLISNQVAIATLILSSFDSHFIYYSRNVREYIILVPLILLISLFIDKVVGNFPKAKFLHYFLLVFLLVLFSSISFEVLLIVLSIIFFILFLVLSLKKSVLVKLQKNTDNKIKILIIFFLISLSLLVANFLPDIKNIFENNISHYFFLSQPNLEYLSILVDTYRISYFSLFFLALSLIYFIFNKNKMHILFLLFIPLFVLTFIFDYSAAIRYLLPFKIFMHISVSIGIIVFINLLFPKIKKFFRILILILICFFITNFSIEWIKEKNFLTEKPQSQWNHGDSIKIDMSTLTPNIRAASNYLLTNYLPGDIIITRDYIVYYYLGPIFNDLDLDVYFIEKNDDNLIELKSGKIIPTKNILDLDSRKWLLIGRTTYLSKEVKNYINNNMILLSPQIDGIFKINYSNTEIIYWPQIFIDKS